MERAKLGPSSFAELNKVENIPIASRRNGASVVGCSAGVVGCRLGKCGKLELRTRSVLATGPVLAKTGAGPEISIFKVEVTVYTRPTPPQRSLYSEKPLWQFSQTFCSLSIFVYF